MEEFSKNCYPEEIAEKLYNLMTESDKNESTKGQQIEEIERALYGILIIAENKYNNDYWRTFYRTLESITSTF